MQDLLSVLINAILLGGLYALIGIGLSVMMGIVKVVNLAHGSLVILASFLSLLVLMYFEVGTLYTLIAVLPAMFVIGYFIQKLILNKVLGKEMEAVLLCTFGLSIIIENLLLHFFTADSRGLPSDLTVGRISLFDGFINFSAQYFMVFVVSGAVILLFYFLFQKTYLGWSIRATSDDEEIAQLMGINTKNTFAYAMGLAMCTAAVAGVLYGTTFTFYATTGPRVLIVAFAATIIGGMGTMRGVFLGGIVLAAAQMFAAHFFGTLYFLLAGYLILVLVLIVKPEGLVRGG